MGSLTFVSFLTQRTIVSGTMYWAESGGGSWGVRVAFPLRDRGRVIPVRGSSSRPYYNHFRKLHLSRTLSLLDLGVPRPGGVSEA